jgi:electron transfer flavoprotein alpha subunit
MVLAFVEHEQEVISAPSLQMLTLARNLAAAANSPLAAVLIGGATSLAQDLAEYGVTAVHRVQHEQLDCYAPVAWARSLDQLVQTLAPDVVLAAGTDRSQEVLGHLAAQRDLPLAANCIAVQPGRPYCVTRQRFGGSLLEEALLHGQPALLTVALHATAAEKITAPLEVSVSTMTPTLSDHDLRVRVTGRLETVEERIQLADARVVVGGGRGVGAAEGFVVLEELAALLNGAVGASRVATNNGWRPHADQIGQTGSRIAPELYIACGISGAIQHIVGCRAAKRILAINSDPEAAIMAKADYAVIGDLHEILPAVIQELRSGARPPE